MLCLVVLGCADFSEGMNTYYSTETIEYCSKCIVNCSISHHVNTKLSKIDVRNAMQQIPPQVISVSKMTAQFWNMVIKSKECLCVNRIDKRQLKESTDLVLLMLRYV